jgi:acyl-CoA dehydrogenase
MELVADRVFLTPEHHEFRRQIRRFVRDRLTPNVDRWEREQGFEREVYVDTARAGFLCVGIAEEDGGVGGDAFHVIIAAEEFTRSGSPGLAASLGSLMIGVPPIIHAGTQEQKDRWLPRVLSGEWIAALAITEPGGGSDVASLRTTARRDGDHFIVNGSKTFITSGTRADLLTVAVRTGGDGAGGVSVLAVERQTPGFTVGRKLEKLGWHASDTAELFFEDARVPVDSLIGQENGGFGILMQNFAMERLVLAATSVEIAAMAYEAAAEYAKERVAFGRPIATYQVTRHKLADMRTAIEQARAFTYAVAARVIAGDPCMAEVAMAKNAATDMASWVVDEALQLHGGAGYMYGTLVERLYRDIRLYPIGGGTREIMNEVISRFT